MDGCNLLSDFEERVKDSQRRTDQTGKEHGFAICGEVNSLETTEIKTGETNWIETPRCSVGDSISLSVHTHPSGNIGLSESDWRSFVTDNLQYPPDTEFDSEMVRGECIVGERLGDNTPTMHCITATEDTRNLSIEEQKSISMEILSDINSKGIGFGGTNPAKDFDQFINECYLNL